MQTILDLPDELLRQAEITAAERGMTLPALVGEALALVIKKPISVQRARRRLKFPLVKSDSPGTLKITNVTLAELEAEEDVRRHGLAR